MKLQRKAQNLMEYLILLAAVIAVLLVFLHPRGPFRDSAERVVSETTMDMLNGMINYMNEINFGRR